MSKKSIKRPGEPQAPASERFWESTSIKSLGKYPHIKLSDAKCRELNIWLQENKLSPLVPPVFPAFVIDAGADRTIYIEYAESLTSYSTVYWFAGKKYFAFKIDYAEFKGSGESMTCATNCETISTSAKDEWVKSELRATVVLIAAVQSYLLYHKPEVSDEPPKERHVSSEPKPYIQRPRKPIIIRTAVSKTITIGDEESPPRKYNYRAMAWQVRGYYQHVGHDKHLAYIAPHIRKRSEKKRKVKPQSYIIEEKKDAT